MSIFCSFCFSAEPEPGSNNSNQSKIKDNINVEISKDGRNSGSKIDKASSKSFISSIVHYNLKKSTQNNSSVASNKKTASNPDISKHPLGKIFLLGETNKILCKIVSTIIDSTEKGFLNNLAQKLHNGCLLDIYSQDFFILNKLSQTCHEIYSVSPSYSKTNKLQKNMKVFDNFDNFIASGAKIDVALLDFRNLGKNLFPNETSNASSNQNIFSTLLKSFMLTCNIIIMLSSEIILNDLAELFSILTITNKINDGRYNIEIEEVRVESTNETMLFVYFGITSVTREIENLFFKDYLFPNQTMSTFEQITKHLIQSYGTKEFLKMILKYQRINESEKIDEIGLTNFLQENIKMFDNTQTSADDIRGFNYNEKEFQDFKAKLKSLGTGKKIQNQLSYSNHDNKPIPRARSMERLQEEMKFEKIVEKIEVSIDRENTLQNDNAILPCTPESPQEGMKNLKKKIVTNQNDVNDDNSEYSYSSNFIRDFASSPESLQQNLNINYEEYTCQQ